MISDATLVEAVRNGLITTEQADRLRAFEARASAVGWTTTPDDESLRFVSGFADVFVAIGLVLFLGAAGFFAERFFGHLAFWLGIAAWLGVAALSWLLAEFFTRRRRMALPSIILLAVFAGVIFAAGIQILSGSAGFWSHLIGVATGNQSGMPIFISGLATAAAVAIHYWRFRVPIAIAAGAAALSASFVALGCSLSLEPSRWLVRALILVCGLAIFAIAMRFDGTDPQRVTRRSDIAFWLHLLAAPMIVHPVVSYILDDASRLEISAAVAILVLFLGFAFIALAIDRRAILVSGLTYAGIAFGALLRQTGITDMSVPATLLALGSFVLLLSAGWRPLRRAILYCFPSSLTRRLPSAIPTSS